MKKYLLEVCVDSVESAIAALRGGANRLELCSNLIIGGTTPSIGLYRQVKEYCNIPIHVLIRPRYGDFLYTDKEQQVMLEDVKIFQEEGASGIVIGALNPDGSLQDKFMREVIKISKGMSITLHRAFDVCADPMETMDKAIELGIDTILTSGQKNHCLEGVNLIADLVNQAANRIDIMVGGGVNASVIKDVYSKTNATTYHMSGKAIKPSGMTYRKEGISMGVASLDEYSIWQTVEENIRAAKDILVQFVNYLPLSF
ncbi:MAG: copper homeostasis protein CutC [Clostridiales bacterium]|nr:copper homeostasis protein CutC [Clostridiales bacterium]